MSIFRTVVFAGLLFSTAGYAVNINLDTTAIFDDFNDAYGDSPKQCALAAIYGIMSFNNQPWKGGGFWYTVNDTNGSGVYAVTRNNDGDVTDSTLISSSNDSLIIHDSTLDVKLSTSKSTGSSKYAGVKCNLIGSGKNSVDLSKMDTISIYVKGHGVVRMQLETEDYIQAKFTWGYYGVNLTLPSSWTVIQIPVDNLKPDDWSDALGAGWTWNHGKNSVIEIGFSVKDGSNADIQIGNITFGGMTYRDFKFANTGIAFRAPETAVDKSSLRISGSKISFKSYQNQNITVSLYNAMGIKVRELFKGKSASGELSLNERGLSKGTYEVVLHGKNITQSRTLVITR